MDEKALFFQRITDITGKSQKEIYTLYESSKLEKHTDIRNLFMETLGLSYGFANTLAHYVAKTDSISLTEDQTMEDILSEIYSGEKMKFRPIHEYLIQEINQFGDFEIAPKKGYVSLKRKKQFAMIGPKTNSRMEIGINSKTLKGDSRLIEQPKGSMCHFIIKIEKIEDVDSDLISWLKQAYLESI